MTIKITFYSLIPGLVEAYPVIPAKNYRPKWIEAAKADFKSKSSDVITKDFVHVYHCPGIFDLFNQGFIVPMWHDVVIGTNGDKKNYRWQVPSDTMEKWMPDTPIITHHDNVAKFIPFPHNSMEIVMKFNTPWRVIVPRGIKLLILPLNYSDNNNFTSVTGVLDPGFSSEMNIQLYWHALNDTVLIKAGTPMMQIIPLTEKKYELVCRYKNKWDELWNLKKKFISTSTWNFKRNVAKDAYHEHYKDEH